MMLVDTPERNVTCATEWVQRNTVVILRSFFITLKGLQIYGHVLQGDSDRFDNICILTAEVSLF